MLNMNSPNHIQSGVSLMPKEKPGQLELLNKITKMAATNEKLIKPRLSPERKIFDKMKPKPLEDEEIHDIISKNEKIDECVGLAASLNLYTKSDSKNCKEFQAPFMKDLKQRKRQVMSKLDPKNVNRTELLQNSKILQFAYLDRIIENIDEDQSHNPIDKLVKKADKAMLEEHDKSRLDIAEIDLS